MSCCYRAGPIRPTATVARGSTPTRSRAGTSAGSSDRYGWTTLPSVTARRTTSVWYAHRHPPPYARPAIRPVREDGGPRARPSANGLRLIDAGRGARVRPRAAPRWCLGALGGCVRGACVGAVPPCIIESTRSAELPPVAAVDARHEGGHRLVRGPRLQLVEGGLPLLALAALELVRERASE